MRDVWDLDVATGSVKMPLPETITIKKMPLTETITITDGDFICICGNVPAMDGFYPSLDDGTEVEPTVDGRWGGKLYTCAQCGRIIDQNTGKVTGVADYSKLADEQGWDDLWTTLRAGKK